MLTIDVDVMFATKFWNGDVGLIGHTVGFLPVIVILHLPMGVDILLPRHLIARFSSPLLRCFFVHQAPHRQFDHP
jgi:hypothetical protein